LLKINILNLYKRYLCDKCVMLDYPTRKGNFHLSRSGGWSFLFSEPDIDHNKCSLYMFYYTGCFIIFLCNINVFCFYVVCWPIQSYLVLELDCFDIYRQILIYMVLSCVVPNCVNFGNQFYKSHKSKHLWLPLQNVHFCKFQ
jgi:hypothetical protein